MMEDTVNKCDNLWPLLLNFDALLCPMIFLSYSFTNDRDCACSRSACDCGLNDIYFVFFNAHQEVTKRVKQVRIFS